MPKGTKEFLQFSAVYFHCEKTDIRRQFTTESEAKKYIKRHAKFCSCPQTEEATGIVSTHGSRRPMEMVINDISTE